MAKFPPWWNDSGAKHSEIEMLDFGPEDIEEIDEGLPVAQAEEIVAAQAQQVGQVIEVQNNMDIFVIGSLVAMIAPLLFLFLFFLVYCGSGPSYRGSAFRDSAANLRDDAAGKLRDARPIGWSGVLGGGSDSYASKVGQQQVWLEMIAAADQRVADTLETQAAQVEGGRQGLEAAIAALLGGLAVAEVMHGQWEAARGTPAAPALAAVLVVFIKVLLGTTAAAALGVLFFQVDAGQRNAKRFTAARDQYTAVVRGIAATMPSSVVSAVAAPIGQDVPVSNARTGSPALPQCCR